MSDGPTLLTIDGNRAAAEVAHRCNEVIAIYPITPASPMGEWADEWSSLGRPNLWGTVPEVVEMQSEGGAAGAIHGALQAGALVTSFTASQGLLLMIPNLYKIAGELSPLVLHVASRSLAVQALSIFGDHGDVMACRGTGFALLCSGSVQEVMDFAFIAQAATLEGRVPFIHFFDGFRTSHEVAKIASLTDEDMRALLDPQAIAAHRQRALTPDRPVVRGTSQNPDAYFQGREAVNPWYQALPGVVQGVMDRFAGRTGRVYRLFDYHGHPRAERVVILMGSGSGAVRETVDHLEARGERVGMVQVRLYRPFSAAHLLAALPPGVERIAVLDRTKEAGSGGEPLYKDVTTALARAFMAGEIEALPQVSGGRYGLSSKEFTPAMVKALFDELRTDRPRREFTLGIHDDVSGTSLEWDPAFRVDANEGATACVFYGLGSDGTVSANKNSIKIIGEATDFHAQGYFQYDSKKAGAVTVSHLRFGPRPIHSTYLIGEGDADFMACHQEVFLERYEMLAKARPGGTFLLNTQAPADGVWDRLPLEVQEQILAKGLRFYVVDAYAIAAAHDLGRRINTIMQMCFFAITGILDVAEARRRVEEAVRETYGRKGRTLVERNLAAIGAALEGLHEVAVPARPTTARRRPPVVPEEAPAFVREVTAPLIAGRGDDLPVSRFPADGTWPLGTAAWEKRDIALEIPRWEPGLCTQCGKCPLVCPHAAIRAKVFPPEALVEAPADFMRVPVRGKDFPAGWYIAYQVAPEDCTGCGLCVEVCPIRDKEEPERKALNLTPDREFRDAQKAAWSFFLDLPEYDRRRLQPTKIKHAMILQPLFEFSGACSGCGETPYIRLATQLFGDRMLIANATGCSSIYGGNLPTTPYAANAEGRGPAWNNSLFEDNAEFGFGLRIAIDQHRRQAEDLLRGLSGVLGGERVRALLEADQADEAGIHEQRRRVAALKEDLEGLDRPEARRLLAVADYLVRKSVWLVGGDGWAYDIGYGGLDHVLASGRDVNILVLDTEVYSNTGGQTSKATPLGAVAKFSAAGKPREKKDLALMAMAYGDVYVARVAFGAKDVQTLRVFLEAESYPGPSLILAYSPCIAHGVDLSNNLRQQDLAVAAGHWGLFRYDPRRLARGENPLHLDTKGPTIPFRDWALTETRFSVLTRTHPDLAERYLRQAQADVESQSFLYEQLAHLALRKTEDGRQKTEDRG